MMPSKVSSWVLLVGVNVVALTACGGVSSIGKGHDDGKGGTETGIGASGNGASSTNGAAPSKAGESMGASSTGASPTTGGSGAGAAPGTECSDNSDCSQSGATCEKCADGSVACEQVPCIGGKCTPIRTACNDECNSDMDCPVPDIACSPCDGGGSNCPVASCSKGKCQVTFPSCASDEFCKGKACGTSCMELCPAGKCDPMGAFCDGNGSCVAGLPQCNSGEMCGTAKDCPAAPPNCVACDASGSTCAGFDCIEGLCVFTCPAVPTPQCKTSEECPVTSDGSCQLCPNGKCAVQACLQNSCQPVCPL